ncbi:IS5 family transposase, partial [Nitrosomonas communis]|uniref:IS5 family transposase n=1 Tax=Nitrosomonas communis TaxID=44574 RepID=UPI003D265628
MQLGFFDLDNRYAQLSKLNDPLEELNRIIDWNLLADLLAETTTKPRKSEAGRKPFDRVMLFKMLVLQRMNNLSDDRLEYQVRDRLSFMRFLGLGLAGVVPDAKTMWSFREELKENHLMDRLFARFDECLRELEVELKSGQIIDATFVSVPEQRNTREENKMIKEDAVPIEWGQNPHKLAQKDIDARWTKKNSESFYGYKDHVNMDRDTKLITTWEVTSAQIHDSQVLEEVLPSPEVGGADIYADSAYRSNAQEESLVTSKYTSQIHEKGARNHPLTQAQKSSNKEKSRVRARVEHVFGSMTNELGGITIRTIGYGRAKVQIGLLNLVYNIKRVATLIRKGYFSFDRVSAPEMA